MAAHYPEIASESRSKLSQNRCSHACQRAPRRRVLEPGKSRLRHQITTALGQPLAGSAADIQRIATVASNCWQYCSVCFPFSGNCSPTAPIKGRSFTVSWPASCPTSRPRSSSDPIGSRASSSSPGVGWSNVPSLAQSLPPIGQGLGKPQPHPSRHSSSTIISDSLRGTSCSENTIILHKVSGRTLGDFP